LADIFREVEEDLRRDKLEELWAKYGTLLIGAAVGFVVLVGATIFWRDYQATKQGRLSDEFAAATQLWLSTQSDQAIEAFDAIAGSSGSGYGTLAKMQKAAILLDQGKHQEALAIYDGFISGGAGDPVMKELAQIKAAWVLADTASLADLKARVGDIAGSDSDWKYSAREIIAYSALKTGDLDAARFGYAELANDMTTPRGIAERAAIMLSVIGPVQVPAGPAETAAPEEPAAEAEPTAPATETPATDATSTEPESASEEAPAP
jgi:hypothetical protein